MSPVLTLKSYCQRHVPPTGTSSCSKSGAAASIRQSGNILGIATALCSRSISAIGFVNQHRVLSLVKGLCRTASTCEAGLVVGALRIVCNGLCTAARFHTAEENPGCLLGCHEGLDSIRHCNRCPTLFESLWRFSMIFCSKLLSEATGFAFLLLGFLTRSSRLTTCREPTVARVLTAVSLCMGESK